MEEGFLRYATRRDKNRRGRKSRVAPVGMTVIWQGRGDSMARAEGGGKGNVVDFGVGAPVGAGGDGDFEFAGEIVELGVAG